MCIIKKPHTFRQYSTWQGIKWELDPYISQMSVALKETKAWGLSYINFLWCAQGKELSETKSHRILDMLFFLTTLLWKWME